MSLNVDIVTDLNSEDESGYVWSFLDEATDPRLVRSGAILLAGDGDAVAVVEVVGLTQEPSGDIVQMRILPGHVRDYADLVRRATAAA